MPTSDDGIFLDLTGLPDFAIPAALTAALSAPPPVSQVHYYGYTSRPTQLGDFYEQTLKLDRKQVQWLNKFTAPSRALIEVEAVRDAVVQLYLAVMPGLESTCKAAGSTLPKDVKTLEDRARYTQSYRYWDRGYYSRSEAGHRAGAAVYLTIFQRCENALRAHYDTRLLDKDVYFAHLAGTDFSFDNFFGDAIEAKLAKLVKKLLPPADDDLEIALNQHDSTRWKPRFEQLLPLLPANPAGFMDGVYELGRLNDRNHLVGAIYLEAARQLGALGGEQTLHLYFHYLHYGARHKYPFKPKPLLKTVLKKLLPLPEHRTRFENLMAELLRYQNLADATDRIPSIFYKERKKIQLDMGAVQTARQQHSGTVELLNEYLQDEAAPETIAPGAAAAPVTAPKRAPARPKKQSAAAPAKAAAAPGLAAASARDFASSLPLSAAQQELLLLFQAQQLALPLAPVEALAKRHGLLRNQLIDGLNAACEELLDDVLIEEADGGYAIYAAYFQKLTA